MMKQTRVVTIQDISCFGKCSLTVALPMLSSMGLECAVIPTAVLSTHTAFPDPHCHSLTDTLLPIAEHWQSVGATFDAIGVGYLADPLQAEKVGRVLDLFPSTVILDPAMGDHGRLYKGLDEDHVAAMAEVCMCADILLPNVTEAALLAELPYREQTDGAYLRSLTAALLQVYHAQAVVITGVSSRPETLGFCGADREEGTFVYQNPVVERQFHGTGDLFSAVFTGALLAGSNVYEAGVRAADFVRLCAAQTPCVSPHGIEFEPQLPKLWI